MPCYMCTHVYFLIGSLPWCITVVWLTQVSGAGIMRTRRLAIIRHACGM